MHSSARDIASWSTCPGCRLPLPGGRMVCTTCGSIVPAERWGARVRAIAGRARSEVVARLRSVPVDRWLWVLALLPFNVIAPVIAASLSFARWRRPEAGPDERRQLETILIVCVINVGLSAYGLTLVASQFGALASEVTQWLGGLYPGRRQPSFRYI